MKLDLHGRRPVDVQRVRPGLEQVAEVCPDAVQRVALFLPIYLYVFDAERFVIPVINHVLARLRQFVGRYDVGGLGFLSHVPRFHVNQVEETVVVKEYIRRVVLLLFKYVAGRPFLGGFVPAAKQEQQSRGIEQGIPVRHGNVSGMLHVQIIQELELFVNVAGMPLFEVMVHALLERFSGCVSGQRASSGAVRAGHSRANHVGQQLPEVYSIHGKVG